MKKTYKFKRGEVHDLDTVYNIMGLIPDEAYEQDDIARSKSTNNNDCGDTVRFTKSVTIKVDVTVKR